jgi:hypothetical protein
MSRVTLDQVDNFYEIIPKEFKDEERTYEAYNDIQIKLPFQLILTGSTGSGKTNALLRLFARMKCFDQVMLYAKDLEESLYKYLASALQNSEKTTGIHVFSKSDDISTLPPVTAHNRKLTTLCIIDDMINEKHKALKEVAKYWTMGRKRGLCPAFLTQSYFDSPTIMRKNNSHFIFTKINGKTDLTMILRDFALGVDDDMIMSLFQAATKGGFPNFFMIDTVHPDPRYRFRRNFDPMDHPAVPRNLAPAEVLMDGEKRGKTVQFNDNEDVLEIEPRINKRKAKKKQLIALEDDDNKSDAELKHETDEERATRLGMQPIKKKRADKPSSAVTNVLSRLSQLLHKPVAELKRMAKSKGLSDRQLCEILQDMIYRGEIRV